MEQAKSSRSRNPRSARQEANEATLLGGAAGTSSKRVRAPPFFTSKSPYLSERNEAPTRRGDQSQIKLEGSIESVVDAVVMAILHRRSGCL